MVLIRTEDEIDELVNRTMRNNIVVKGIPEDPKEDWETTKTKLCEHLAILSNENVHDIKEKIDRAHRGGKPQQDRDRPRNIYANFLYSTDASYYVEESVKYCVKNKNNCKWRVENQFSTEVNDRRNQAMLLRKQLLQTKQIAQGHLVFPAKLYGKKDRAQKQWDLIKEF